MEAMGNSITHLRQYLEEDDNVLVTIITDGYENSSREWTHQSIFRHVEELNKTNWLFTYIGANQDAMSVAKGMGIDHSMNFDADVEGTKAMFLKEKRSRSALYEKLSKRIKFSNVKDEKFFVDEKEES